MASIRLIALATAPALLLGACMTEPWDRGPIVNPQTASREAGPPDRCEPGEIRSYRPDPDKKSAPYDAAIPPTYDTPSRLPSQCKRERD